MKDPRIVIIGNGIAGNSAASEIRKASRLADVTMISDEPLQAYSACVIHNYLAGEIPRSRVFLKTPSTYSQENITTMFGKKALKLETDAKRVILENEALPYDKLILATGGRNLIPRIEGVNLEGVFFFKSISDVDTILKYRPKTTVVVGSGPIGVQASMALRMGLKTDVYLVELLDWIMPKAFDETPALMLRKIMEDNGVKVFTHEKALKIKGDKKVESVVTDKREIPCDSVILAVGMKPETELAQSAGIEIGALGGIKTDEYMMTNVKNVYACGDCIESQDIVTGKQTLSLLWHNAKQQGYTAGRNCMDIKKPYLGSISLVGLDVFHIHTVSIGSTMSSFDSPHNLEVIEGTRGRKREYHRLLIANEILMGAQLIGDNDDVGALVHLLRKKKNIRQLQIDHSRNKLPVSSEYYRIHRYFVDTIK